MSGQSFRAIQWRSGTITLLDQTQLPNREAYVEARTVEDVAQAIERLVVRGAPAIGITAAYGMVLAAEQSEDLEAADRRLRRTRPTAVNLFWALDRMARVWRVGGSAAELADEATRIDEEDAASCRRIGELGAEIIPDGARILTHCNAGALATSELGTALAVIRVAHARGKRIQVFADETRPVLQGARLTMWELMKDGIDVTLVPDVAVAHLLYEEQIDCAIVGADRVAKNGDVANKIGTRGVACLMCAHEKPFYVAAPWSTFDPSLEDGRAVEIEERNPEEVRQIRGVAIAPEGARVRNPAFDVTPARWVSDLVTDRGRTGADLAAGLARLMGPEFSERTPPPRSVAH
ncbi:MAG: S-methyl-5-thioribose-1-phosphate isomerase [Myxococcota bacterium]